jgi:protein-S-isoprenylcysteine O-methyltransferase Ste14
MTEIGKPTAGDRARPKVREVIPADDCQREPPKLFAWIASGMTISLIVVAQFLPRGGDLYLRGAGVFVLLIAGVFIFWPFYLLAKYGRTKDGQSYMQARIVVDRGLYAITRHPQYLGYVFLSCGFALLSQHWAAVLLAAVGSTCFYLQAVGEERYCLTQFGVLYERYQQRVPRFNVVLGTMRLLRMVRSDRN